MSEDAVEQLLALGDLEIRLVFQDDLAALVRQAAKLMDKSPKQFVVMAVVETCKALEDIAKQDWSN